MIVTQGGRFGGYGLFLSKGEFGIGRSKPVFLYNLLDLKRTAWAGPELEAGKHTVVFDFNFDGGGFGQGGTGVLIVDGKEVDKKHMENTTPIMFPEDEDFDIGQVYTPERYAKLLASAIDDHDVTLYLLLAGLCFLRSQELVRRLGNEEVLLWSDVWVDRKLIHVREGVGKSTRRKSGNERFPPIHPNLLSWLQLYKPNESR
jgi:hypothetical protein